MQYTLPEEVHIGDLTSSENDGMAHFTMVPGEWTVKIDKTEGLQITLDRNVDGVDNEGESARIYGKKITIVPTSEYHAWKDAGGYLNNLDQYMPSRIDIEVPRGEYDLGFVVEDNDEERLTCLTITRTGPIDISFLEEYDPSNLAVRISKLAELIGNKDLDDSLDVIGAVENLEYHISRLKSL